MKYDAVVVGAGPTGGSVAGIIGWQESLRPRFKFGQPHFQITSEHKRMSNLKIRGILR